MGLSLVYEKWTLDEIYLRGTLAVLSAIILILLAWLFAERGLGLLGVVGASYICIMAPMLGLFDFGFMAFSYVADRYHYLASAFPLGVCSYGICRIPLSDRARIAVSTIIIAAMSIVTFVQTTKYIDPVKLWFEVTERNPKAFIAQTALGDIYLRRNQIEIAKRCYTTSLRMEKRQPRVWNNLGVVFAEEGEVNVAGRCFREALRLSPGLVQAERNLEIYGLNQRQE